MKNRLNLKSKSGIHRIISALEERGFVRKLANKARAIEVIETNISISKSQDITNRVIEIPHYGKIAAGTPIEAISTSSSSITTPLNMIGVGEHYALEISGDSMIELGINNKDIALIKKCKIANNGEIVVALIDKSEATLKKFKKTSSNIVLIPANDLYQTQTYEYSRVEIQGILVGIMRKY
jgi:repressor LexA